MVLTQLVEMWPALTQLWFTAFAAWNEEEDLAFGEDSEKCGVLLLSTLRACGAHCEVDFLEV